MIKLLIFLLILYFGYRLAYGPPLLKNRNSPRVRQEKEDDKGYTDYEEIK